MSVTGVTGASGSANAQGSSSTAAALPAGVAPTQDMFLKLLVAQIKNQNPLSPADGVQFLSQLAQFSQLEQTVGIREAIDGLRSDVAKTSASSGNTKPAGGQQ